MNFAIVGSGFSGSVLANKLALAGHNVEVFESRPHVGGNCYTEKDFETGITIHTYGPHIFHTDNEVVWNFISSFSKFIPYINRVKTNSNGKIYSLPINLHTINQFFNKNLNPSEAKKFIESLTIKFNEPKSFKEQAYCFVGKDLYEAFLKGYTLKQWGINPENLPASILKRLPVRFNYDDNYFNHKYQGMPINGYTPIFNSMLNHKNIELHLNTKFENNNRNLFDHIIWTGTIDSWFNYKFGKLGYRTLDFVKEKHVGDYQGCAVMNYADESVAFTRISEHKHFSPWQKFKDTLVFKEFSRECEENDIPYYPIRLNNEKEMLVRYIKEANSENDISFVGRLGTYRYLDMDITIAEALNASATIIENIKKKIKIPSFFVDPN